MLSCNSSLKSHMKQHNYHYKSRAAQGLKIITLLKKFREISSLNKSVVLDIGCGSGEITSYVANNFFKIIGGDLEIDTKGKYDSISHHQNLMFICCDAKHLPFERSVFDIIICAQVYEHVDDSDQLFSQIHDALRPGGICFLSGPNKFAILEDHYKLPLLSWLPQQLADRYLRLTRGVSEYDVRPRSYWTLRKALATFDIIDCLPALLGTPELLTQKKSTQRIMAFISKFAGSYLIKTFVPNFNWILVKNHAN